MIKRLALMGVLVAAALGLSSGPVSAQGVYVYPSQGQSPEQQQRDMAECHVWAVQQTGFDPSRQQQQSSNVGRSAGRGALGGALLGGLIGSMDGNWGKGAAIGAGAGGLMGGMRGSAQDQAQQDRINAAYDAYNRARATCLVGRGYAVQ